ncbi:MAG: tandem-95 repeat protein, partial [Macromonas sp.]
MSQLAQGQLTVTMSVRDVAGNAGSVTDTTTLDTVAPATGDNQNSITFNDGGDELVNANEATSVTLSGKVEVGNAVTGVVITDANGTTQTVDLADVSVAADGTVTIAGQDLSGLAQGQLTVTMSVRDVAGNAGTVTDTTTLDTVAPTVTVDSLKTNDTTPELTGTVNDPTAAVVVTVNGTPYTATNNGDGTWTLADNTLSTLPEGSVVVTATATDTAGNQATGNGTLVIDLTPPSNGDGENSIQFNDGGDEYVNAAESGSVTLAGKIAPDSLLNSVSITDSLGTQLHVPLSDISVDNQGVVTVSGQDLSALEDGPLTVVMTVTDAAGNTGTISDTTVLDTMGPVVGINPLITNDDTPMLTGTIDDHDASVVLTINGQDYPATNNGDGTWTLADNTLPPLGEGTVIVTVTATDLAGNKTSNTGPLIIDQTAPTNNDGENSLKFEDGGDALVNGQEATMVMLTGHVAIGSLVNSIIISDSLGNSLTVNSADIRVDANGSVHVAAQNLSTLADGPLTATMSVTDLAGNTGDITDTTTLDTVVTPGNILVNNFSDSGSNTSDRLSNDNTFNLDITGQETGSTVVYQVSTDNGANWTDTTTTQTGLADGPYQFRAVVTDIAGNSATTSPISLTIDATGPNAVTDLRGVLENASISGTATTNGLLLNDSDASAMTITAIRTGALTGNGTAGSLGGLINGTYGTLKVNADGSYQYAANRADSLPQGQTAPDTFTYTVTDAAGNSSQAELVITVTGVNDAPRAIVDSVSTNEDTPITINVLANDTDIDSTVLAITSATVPAAQGTVAIVNNQLVFTPAANFNGKATITYVINDGIDNSAAASVTVTVNPVNDVPVAVADTLSATEDTPITFTALQLLGNDTDVDGDTLQIASVASGTGGTAVLNPDGTVTFTPSLNFNGNATFTYTVTDGSLTSAPPVTVTVQVAPVNDAPVVVQDTLNATEDTPITYSAAQLLNNDSDVDGGTLRIASVTSGPGGSVVLNADGTVTFTPDANFNGNATFSYTVTDGSLTSAPTVVTVQVDAVNDAPTAVNDQATALAGLPVLIDVLANDTDIDGDAIDILSAELVNPFVGQLEIVNGVNGEPTKLRFTPNDGFIGEAEIRYTTTDGQADSTASVRVQVSASQAPIVVNDTVQATEDTPVTFTAAQLLGNDRDPEGQAIRIDSVTSGTGGTVVLNHDGSVTFTPNANFNGDATFTYTVTDGTSSSTPATVTVQVAAVNDAPTSGNDTASTNEDT